MSFTAKIAQVTGASSKNDADTISSSLSNAQHEIIAKIAQFNPDMLDAMSTEESASDNTTTVPVDVNTIVLNVTRHDSTNNLTRNCMPTDKKFENKIQDADSIYYAPKTSPVYLVNKGSVFVYPVPTSDEQAKVLKVEPGTIDDSNETIANMPSSLYPLIVNIASRDVIIQRLGEFTSTLPTDLDSDTTVFDAIADFDDSLGITTALPSISDDYQDALTKAQSLIDDVSSIGGDVNVDGSGTDIYSAQKWLVDEDPEMLNGTLQTASQELQRATAVLSGYSQELNKYQAEVSKESAEAGQALQEYQANLNKKVQLFSTIIGKLNTDYQWLQGQLQIVMAKIQEGYSLIGIRALDSEAKGLGGGIAK